MKKYVLKTTCVGYGNQEDLENLYKNDKEIEKSKFVKCMGSSIKELLDYLNYPTLKMFLNDWYIITYRSRFQGKPCLHLDWSRIDHVYVKEEN